MLLLAVADSNRSYVGHTAFVLRTKKSWSRMRISYLRSAVSIALKDYDTEASKYRTTNNAIRGSDAVASVIASWTAEPELGPYCKEAFRA